MSTAIDRTTPALPDEAFAEFSEVAGIDGFDTADATPDRTSGDSGARQATGPLPTARARRRYWIIFGALAVLAAVFATGILAWNNPMPFGSRGFRLIAEMRLSNLAVMAVVAFCQATATVAFQTVTHNRILTPSIMGFESLYVVIQTAAVFFLGAAGVVAVTGTPQFLGQVAIMVVFSAILYGWLFGGRFGNMQIMLLVGIILGGGMGALSTFMQRMLTPSDFDVLTARLIGSIANADTDHLLISLPIVAFAGSVLWLRATKLNVLGLGRDTATNLGINHKKDTIIVLVMVSMLMAVSTALVGPMTFLGFLVAMIAYQLADTYDHRHVFPIAWLTGFVVLSGSYFVLKNVFYAEGSVGIIIEIVGGTFFLIHILRKGRL